LGIYSLPGRFLALPIIVSLIMAEETYPYMAEQYGPTGNIASLKPLVKRLVASTFAISVFFAVVLLLGFPLLVCDFLPAYLSSLPLLIPMLLRTVLLSQCIGFGAFLAASDRQIDYLILLAVWIVLGILVLVGVILAGGKLVGVATGMAGIYAGFLISLVVSSARVIMRDARR
jgi:O-antigen/teichoic acid export membrane protein